MYEKINITENTLRVLSLFTHGFKRDLYIREIERSLDISPRTAQLVLEDLESKGVLHSCTRGKIRLFSLKRSRTTSKYLSLAEQYKAISFFQEKPLISDVVSAIDKHADGIGMVFGSYVKCSEDKSSDLDIFVAGRIDEEAVEKISRKYKIEINVKCYPDDIFRSQIENDILLKEVLDNHIIFKGIEDLLKMVMPDHEDRMVQEKERRSEAGRAKP